MEDKELMRLAIEEAEKGRTPFGCVIALDGHIVSKAYNTVSTDHDPTAHAEINALRAASRKYQGPQHNSMVIYTTCEPCPMCMAAIIFGGFKGVFFGVDIATAKKYLHQINIPCREVADRSGKEVGIHQSILAEACEELFRKYAMGGPK